VLALVGATIALAAVPGAGLGAEPYTIPTDTQTPTVIPSSPVAGSTKLLSNERTFTRSANVAEARRIYAKPDPKSRKRGRLHYWTEDHRAEVYLALRSYVDARGREWTQIRIPGRPNGRKGWVVRDALGPFRMTRQLLVVNRRHRTISLYRNGKLRFRRPVGIGKPSTPTPAGHFWIREKLKVNDRRSPYFPYALGTANYSVLSEWPGGGVVGIHGDWNQPRLIPGRPSHGCIRMHNRDIANLARRIDLGAPLRIL
jgi:lipoprotein-anchoring transpeptidase ErfK/SrfK